MGHRRKPTQLLCTTVLDFKALVAPIRDCMPFASDLNVSSFNLRVLDLQQIICVSLALARESWLMWQS